MKKIYAGLAICRLQVFFLHSSSVQFEQKKCWVNYLQGLFLYSSVVQFEQKKCFIVKFKNKIFNTLFLDNLFVGLFYKTSELSLHNDIFGVKLWRFSISFASHMDLIGE